MKKEFMILGIFSLLALLLIAGCQHKPRPIGGDKDKYGCLIGAGYSWNATIGACIREWELDASQRKAAEIVILPMNARPVTVVEVETLKCAGCFNVKIRVGTAGNNTSVTIKLVNWTIQYDELCTTCPQLSPPAPGFCAGGTVISGGKNSCGCQLPPTCERKNNTGMANPASTFCIAQGGESKIITAADGSQSGLCTLPYGVECDEWAFFRDECPVSVNCTAEQKAAEICTMEYMPVCGDDGVTYGNKCSACASKNIDSYKPGECPAKTYVTRDPEQCKVIRYLCVKGKVPFSDEYGCGCEPEQAQSTCGNGICDPGEANVCPACYYSTPPCLAPCTVGTCPDDCINTTAAGTGKLKANDCTEPRTQACTKEYVPVCGWRDVTLACANPPCKATYGNKCTACADKTVAYWTDGTCPN